MVETTTSRLWSMRAVYLFLCCAIIFLQLVPLETMPRAWAAPDLLIALSFAWALRRPDFVPALSVAAVMLLADFMLHRPPGLMAAAVVLAVQFLKPRSLPLRDEGFASEMLAVAATLLAVVIGQRIVMVVLLVPTPPLGLVAFQTAMTLLIYPLVVLVSNLVFGVRALAPGDEATGGTRL